VIFSLRYSLLKIKSFNMYFTLGILYKKKIPRICPVCHNHNLDLSSSWFIIEFVTRVTRWVPHVELLTLPEYLSSSAVFSVVCVVRSLVFCVVFCWSLFVLLSFFFFSVLQFTGFWLPLWYLKSFHTEVLILDQRFIVSGWVIVV
jgi:hypothetical protein